VKRERKRELEESIESRESSSLLCSGWMGWVVEKCFGEIWRKENGEAGEGRVEWLYIGVGELVGARVMLLTGTLECCSLSLPLYLWTSKSFKRIVQKSVIFHPSVSCVFRIGRRLLEHVTLRQ